MTTMSVSLVSNTLLSDDFVPTPKNAYRSEEVLQMQAPRHLILVIELFFIISKNGNSGFKMYISRVN